MVAVLSEIMYGIQNSIKQVKPSKMIRAGKRAIQDEILDDYNRNQGVHTVTSLHYA